jgi:hypothetical protein
VEFRSHFNGMILEMTRCKVVIPPLLLVMIFIRALHSCYSDILDQFCSCYKDLEAATVNSVVADVKYHDEFQLVDAKLMLLPSTDLAKNGQLLLNGSLRS